MAFWGNLTVGARPAWDFVGYVREPLTLEQSVELMREHLARREERFLANLERVVFNNTRSPYRGLFAYAGCDLGDIRHSVQQHGLEGALRRLQAAGVYLTSTRSSRGSRRRCGVTVGFSSRRVISTTLWWEQISQSVVAGPRAAAPHHPSTSGTSATRAIG